MIHLKRLLPLLILLMANAGCSKSGTVVFHEGSQLKTPGTNFTLVPASDALVVEDGKTPANGYHAKVEVNPLKGQILTSTSGYSVRMKYTGRN